MLRNVPFLTCDGWFLTMKEIKLDLRPFIKQIDFPHRIGALGSLVGKYKSTFKGSGLEFEGFRHYTINDDANLIDWKASRRSQELLIKELAEERNLDVFFIMDVSDSMLYGSINKLKCEYAAELVATLGFAAIWSDDSVGLSMFNDKVVKTVPLSGGHAQYYIIAKVLSNPKLYGGKFDLGYALRYVLNFLPKNSILIIVSDFIGLKEGWIKNLKIAAQEHTVIGIVIKDRLDKMLPDDPGDVIFSDPFTDKRIILNTKKIRERYRYYAEKQSKELKELCVKLKINLLELTTDEPFIAPVTKFLMERA